ncbi:MAG: PilZ domain-containing protein [Deltaproteobacteria bacterium]
MDLFMPEEHITLKIGCPYFKPDGNGDCQMTRGGLYIPLAGHIEIFCKTTNYSSCPQYIRGLTLIRQSFCRPGEKAESRRQFQRVRNRIPLVISTCDEKGKPVKVIDRDAVTIDISLGGVRVSSNSEIPANKILHCSFQEGPEQMPVTGVGEVRWSSRTEGPLPFQAGLSFLDKTLPLAIGQRLGLQL